MVVFRRVACAGALAVLVVAAGPRAGATGTIRMVTVGSDSVSSPAPGSLRQVLKEVQPGDTIQFAQQFSIVLDRKDPTAILKLAQSGVTIQGPAELRSGLIDLRGDDTVISGMRFADFRVLAGTVMAIDPDSVTSGFAFRGNTLVGDSSLELYRMRNAVVEDNSFDVRENVGRPIVKERAFEADAVVKDSLGEGSRWSNNTWTDTSLGGFNEDNCKDLLFEKNHVVGNAYFSPRSGVIDGNFFSSQVFAVSPDFPFEGTLTVQDNTCGSLRVYRPDVAVLHNTVTGIASVDRRVTCFVVDTAGSNNHPGGLVAADNTITATQGWLVAASVRAPQGTTGCLVSGNTVTGGKIGSLSVFADGAASVVGNTVHQGGKRASIEVQGPMADGLILTDNTVDGGLGAGIGMSKGTGPATLTGNHVTVSGKGSGIFVTDFDTGDLLLEGNTLDGGLGDGIDITKGIHGATLRQNVVKGFRGAALFVAYRTFLSEDCVYRECGTGMKVGKKTKATVRGGTITGNRGTGLYADTGASVEVVQVSFSGNGGAGIDLAPGGVTPNTRKKAANGNMPFPESLEWDASTGRVKGRAEALSRIDAFAVEDGPRAGNPKNGEGATWLGETATGADGKFTFPSSGRLACPASKRVTFTATRQGDGLDPVTSEFSLDVDCSGASLFLIDQTPAGSPGELSSDSSYTSRYRTVSDDGRFVVFTSRATTLVEGDTNGTIDVFLRDTVLGTTTRVNRTPDGGQVEYVSTQQSDAGSGPSISGDGRWIAYASRAQDSFGAGTWYYNDPGIILYDTQTGTNTFVASPLTLADPLPSGYHSYYGGYTGSVSGDGSAVIFSARSGDYAPGDAGDDNDAFVWTRSTGAYERVSVPTGGGDPTNGWQDSNLTTPRLSYDARFAVFASNHNLTAGALPYATRVWVRDRQSGTTEAACIDSTGAIRSGYDPWISDDGRFVVFYSMESLVPADTNSYADVYLRDRQAGTTTLVSANADGTVFYGDCVDPCISGDGRYVSFRNFGDCWRVDRQEGTQEVVSGSATVVPNTGCHSPRISRTGQFIQFDTDATNLVDLGGQSFITHVYLRDLSVTGK